MGKGARERSRRRSTDKYKVELIDTSTRSPEPTFDHDERLALIDVLTRSANRRGVVTGIVAVRNGKVDPDEVCNLIKDSPPADLYILETKEES